jgi:hypothetical protein
VPKADAVNIIDITPNSSTLNPFEKKCTLIMLHKKMTTLIIAATNAWPGRLPTTFLKRFIKIIIFIKLAFYYFIVSPNIEVKTAIMSHVYP